MGLLAETRGTHGYSWATLRVELLRSMPQARAGSREQNGHELAGLNVGLVFPALFWSELSFIGLVRQFFDSLVHLDISRKRADTMYVLGGKGVAERAKHTVQYGGNRVHTVMVASINVRAKSESMEAGWPY